jgi:hypothetical protein
MCDITERFYSKALEDHDKDFIKILQKRGAS